MPILLHGIETLAPGTRYSQEWASELMQEHAATRPATRRVIRSIYRNSGIDTRHSVVDDLGEGSGEPLFFNRDGTRLPPPDTGARNAVYVREARDLFVRLAEKLVTETPGFSASDVTHVITISCTGFFAPGPDYHVVRALGLPGTTERIHVGFMGCYAAFQGFRLARAICRSDPDAVVLVLSVELCSLHLQFNEESDDLIAGAVFADGASGALISARTPKSPSLPEGRPRLELLSLHGELVPEGEDAMAWTIGSEGFRMKLSTYVPELIRTHLPPILGTILEQAGLDRDAIDWWAIHPGGRAILDKVQEELALRDDQISASRAVLRAHGNMSSATILHVLKAVLEDGDAHVGDRVFAMAFGPGLTIESGLFRVISGNGARNGGGGPSPGG